MAENLKQLLLANSDFLAQELMKVVQNSDYAFITPAQSRLLAHMGGKQITMVELSSKLAISRQAVHKTVMELSRQGVLELKDDPKRPNGKIVLYTEKGRQLNRKGAQIIESLEQQIAFKIGEHELQMLKSTLAKILPSKSP